MTSTNEREAETLHQMTTVPQVLPSAPPPPPATLLPTSMDNWCSLMNVTPGPVLGKYSKTSYFGEVTLTEKSSGKMPVPKPAGAFTLKLPCIVRGGDHFLSWEGNMTIWTVVGFFSAGKSQPRIAVEPWGEPTAEMLKAFTFPPARGREGITGGRPLATRKTTRCDMIVILFSQTGLLPIDEAIANKTTDWAKAMTSRGREQVAAKRTSQRKRKSAPAAAAAADSDSDSTQTDDDDDEEEQKEEEEEYGAEPPPPPNKYSDEVRRFLFYFFPTKKQETKKKPKKKKAKKKKKETHALVRRSLPSETTTYSLNPDMAAQFKPFFETLGLLNAQLQTANKEKADLISMLRTNQEMVAGLQDKFATGVDKIVAKFTSSEVSKEQNATQLVFQMGLAMAGIRVPPPPPSTPK